MHQPSAAQATTINLRRLCIIRALVLAAQISAALIAYQQLAMSLPYTTLSAIFVALAAVTLLSWWRSYRPWPVSDEEYFAQLCVDILGLTAVLYFAGGASNPFVSYYLVPLSIAAATLSWKLTGVIAALCVGAYSTLMFYYQPLQTLAPHHGGHGGLNLHILGMWLNFLVSAALITGFVVKMAAALRQREQALNQHREDKLRDEQLLAVATLAAGTAHELGTPLSTMTMLVDEMRDDYPDNDALLQDLSTLREQLAQCKQSLSRLVSTARETSDGDISAVSLQGFVDEVVEQWKITRPDMPVELELAADIDRRQQLRLDPTVSQTLLNLLNNAADASSEPVQLTLRSDNADLVMTVSDRGPGMPPPGEAELGKAFVTTKGKGLGLGLFLSDATASRYGGSLNWRPRQGGGSEVELRLPWERIKESAHG